MLHTTKDPLAWLPLELSDESTWTSPSPATVPYDADLLARTTSTPASGAAPAELNPLKYTMSPTVYLGGMMSASDVSSDEVSANVRLWHDNALHTPNSTTTDASALLKTLAKDESEGVERVEDVVASEPKRMCVETCTPSELVKELTGLQLREDYFNVLSEDKMNTLSIPPELIEPTAGSIKYLSQGKRSHLEFRFHLCRSFRQGSACEHNRRCAFIHSLHQMHPTVDNYAKVASLPVHYRTPVVSLSKALYARHDPGVMLSVTDGISNKVSWIDSAHVYITEGTRQFVASEFTSMRIGGCAATRRQTSTSAVEKPAENGHAATQGSARSEDSNASTTVSRPKDQVAPTYRLQFCIHFDRGMCCRGPTCHFVHRVYLKRKPPATGEGGEGAATIVDHTKDMDAAAKQMYTTAAVPAPYLDGSNGSVSIGVKPHLSVTPTPRAQLGVDIAQQGAHATVVVGKTSSAGNPILSQPAPQRDTVSVSSQHHALAHGPHPAQDSQPVRVFYQQIQQQQQYYPQHTAARTPAQAQGQMMTWHGGDQALTSQKQLTPSNVSSSYVFLPTFPHHLGGSSQGCMLAEPLPKPVATQTVNADGTVGISWAMKPLSYPTMAYFPHEAASGPTGDHLRATLQFPQGLGKASASPAAPLPGSAPQLLFYSSTPSGEMCAAQGQGSGAAAPRLFTMALAGNQLVHVIQKDQSDMGM